MSVVSLTLDAVAINGRKYEEVLALPGVHWPILPLLLLRQWSHGHQCRRPRPPSELLSLLQQCKCDRSLRFLFLLSHAAETTTIRHEIHQGQKGDDEATEAGQDEEGAEEEEDEANEASEIDGRDSTCVT